MIVDLITMPLGLVSSWLLFYRFPVLASEQTAKSLREISVIIPMRNEEHNIPHLLDDLTNQDYPVKEIICVDDQSTDRTVELARSYQVKVLEASAKPEEWLGKSWACSQGASVASGELLLFLDSDVSLAKEALGQLASRYDHDKVTISVLPYHRMKQPYEQFSLFFNLIQVAANGTTLVKSGNNAGLYGPVIMIDRNTYDDIGGHQAIRTSIIDDVALGQKLHEHHHKFKLYLGKQSITFRMYPNSQLDLIRGWLKNISVGAMQTPPGVLVLVLLWVTSIATTALKVLSILAQSNNEPIGIYLVFYALWVGELIRVAPKIGNFKKIVLILFPGYLGFFIAVFALSMIKKLLGIEMVWKDRKIKPRK